MSEVVWRAGFCDVVDQAIADYVENRLDESRASLYVDPSKPSSVQRHMEFTRQVEESKTAMIRIILEHCSLVVSGSQPANAKPVTSPEDCCAQGVCACGHCACAHSRDGWVLPSCCECGCAEFVREIDSGNQAASAERAQATPQERNAEEKLSQPVDLSRLISSEDETPPC